jgi:hypothetical protein
MMWQLAPGVLSRAAGAASALGRHQRHAGLNHDEGVAMPTSRLPHRHRPIPQRCMGLLPTIAVPTVRARYRARRQAKTPGVYASIDQGDGRGERDREPGVVRLMEPPLSAMLRTCTSIRTARRARRPAASWSICEITMASYYVWSAAAGSANGTSWANAYTTLTLAYSADRGRCVLCRARSSGCAVP